VKEITIIHTAVYFRTRIFAADVSFHHSLIKSASRSGSSTPFCSLPLFGDKRVGPGSFLRVPAGWKHWSGGDLKEGALFYEESPGKFDSIPAK
jgi:hypothetical protein